MFVKVKDVNLPDFPISLGVVKIEALYTDFYHPDFNNWYKLTKVDGDGDGLIFGSRSDPGT